MDAAMRRISKENRQPQKLGEKFIDWRKEIRSLEADRNEYVMLISDGDPNKYQTFMNSPVSLFLTALDSFTKKHEKEENDNLGNVKAKKI